MANDMNDNNNQRILHNQKTLHNVDRLMNELSIMTSKLNQSIDRKLKMKARKSRLKHQSIQIVR